ncbi:MAG: hypothetical protein Q9162_004641, partial [Coniocarpon cinnabarinum]
VRKETGVEEAETRGNEEEGKHEDSEDTEKWNGACTFVAASTSGASASLKPAEKEAIWRPLGEWVQLRRRERATAASAADLEKQEDNPKSDDGTEEAG